MAKVDTSGLAKWERSIQNSVGKHDIEAKATIDVPKADSKKVVKLLADEEWLKKVLLKFVQRELLGTEGLLYEEYNKHTKGFQNWPQYLQRAQEGGKRTRRFAGKFEVADSQYHDETDQNITTRKFIPKTESMDRGFAALWDVLKQPVFQMRGSQAIVGIGARDPVMGLRLSEYMGTQGSPFQTVSPYNSLFMAIEYGTGVAKNVGSDGFVRRAGPTKLRNSKFAGAWFFQDPEHPRGTGALFLGQRGFHFLYDARSRKPRSLYEKRVKERFPQYLQNAIRDAL
jgi:hypothetical protein